MFTCPLVKYTPKQSKWKNVAKNKKFTENCRHFVFVLTLGLHSCSIIGTGALFTFTKVIVLFVLFCFFQENVFVGRLWCWGGSIPHKMWDRCTFIRNRERERRNQVEKDDDSERWLRRRHGYTLQYANFYFKKKNKRTAHARARQIWIGCSVLVDWLIALRLSHCNFCRKYWMWDLICGTWLREYCRMNFKKKVPARLRVPRSFACSKKKKKVPPSLVVLTLWIVSSK